MKRMIIVAAALLAATPLHAEIYSWTDHKGTMNFTEDYSQVPVKYRKKIGIRRNTDSSSAFEADKVSGKPVSAVDGKKQVEVKPETKNQQSEKTYGDKTLDIWRSELMAAEAEVKRLDAIIKRLAERLRVGREDISNRELMRQHNDAVAEYNRAYDNYGAMIDAARKVGVPL